jgi:phosphoribosylformimino-5-aminoimidazole carboxamide ribotide isomerase
MLGKGGLCAFNVRMQVLPVMDLLGGQVVRGVGGRRHEYRPIVSRLTPSCQPLDVARTFQTQLGLTELYLADLDAIAGAPPALAIYAALRNLGMKLWVDAGVRDVDQALPLAAADLERIVVGLETVSGPEALAILCRRWGERVVLSLDLKNGEPLGNTSGWQRPDAEAIAAEAVALGVRRLIVLDLACVGENAGPGTELLCRRLTSAHPGVELVAGGGIRDRADLARLRECGVTAVLVASALHDGRLQPQDWREL